MEYFDICDEQGLPTGKTVERSVAHREGICHRTAHVWVVRQVEGRWQVLLQKRSMNKDSFPGRFDTSSAGHIPAGSEPGESALRELQEELGISAGPEDLRFIGQFRILYQAEFHGAVFKDNEIANVFVYQKEVDIADLTLQQEEVECVEWFDLEDTFESVMAHDRKFCVPREGMKMLMKGLGLN